MVRKFFGSNQEMELRKVFNELKGDLLDLKFGNQLMNWEIEQNKMTERINFALNNPSAKEF